MTGGSGALAGAALRVLSVFLLTSMSALVHAVGEAVPVGQIMVWRSLWAIPPILLYMALRGQLPGGLRPRQPGLHVTRGLLGALSMALSFLSFVNLPIATAQALAFLAPVLSLPMAAWRLRERVGRRGRLAAGLGFGGAVAMLWPALGAPGPGGLIGIAAGLGYALTMAFVRVHMKAMTATETAGAIAFWFAIVSALAGFATWPAGWAVLDGGTGLALAAAGLLGGLASIAAVEALAWARVSDIAPFDFTALIWALGFDLVLFGQAPGRLPALGVAAIICAAALALPRRAEAAPAGTALR